MKEIEIKILNINEKEITKKLLKLGAKKISTKLIIEKHFDFNDNKISKNKESFRLRKIGDKVELTYKNSGTKDKNFKIREETEIELKDFKTMNKIIQKLGLKCIKYREKKRTSFKLNKLKFEIDKYPKIPSYLEIEGSKKDIKEILKLLGFNINQTVSFGATKVLEYYKANSKFQRF